MSSHLYHQPKMIKDAAQERCGEMVSRDRAALLALLEAGMTVKLISEPTVHPALDADELALLAVLV